MQARHRRPRWQLWIVLASGAAIFLVFLALGVWQVQRLAWKRDLIARVEARVSAPAVPLSEIAALPPAEQEYRHVTVTGQFDHSAEFLAQAVTELGGGFWLLTPLRLDDGSYVFINRGFVSPQYRDPKTRPEAQTEGKVTVTGLARLPEPGGAFLRQNDPAANRWFSRDINAMAATRDISPIVPLFIDADATAQPGGWPIGGLTVIQFRNTHLVYAMTWFALAALVAGGMIILIRYERPDRDEG